MRKLFAALGVLALAAATAFVTPVAAEAVTYRSPIGDYATAPEGATAGIVCTDEMAATLAQFSAASENVGNYVEPAAGGKYVGSFYAELTSVWGSGYLGLHVSVGKEYAGRTATVYWSSFTNGNGGSHDPEKATVSQEGDFYVPFLIGGENSSWGMNFSINIEPTEGSTSGEEAIFGTVKYDESTSLTVYGNSATTGSITSVVATDKIASNYKDAEGNVVLGSFKIEGGAEDFILTYNVDKKYAGMTALLFVEHEDGATDVQAQQIAEDGTVSFAMDRLSVYTLVVDTTTGSEGAADAGTTAKKDTSSKSPATGARSGAEVSAVACVAVLAAAAGCAALALRKANGR